MIRSPRDGLVAVLIIVAGLAIGGLLAHARASRPAPLVAAARVTAAPSTAAPSTAAPSTAAPRTVAATTPAATSAPATPAAPVAAAAAGTWQIVESNTTVGTIVWTGAGTASGDALALDVRKAEVGGRDVGPCERATHLRATVPAGATSAAYVETNCSGGTSHGEMRIASFSRDGRTLRGAFWKDGAKLGDFTAVLR